MHKFIQPSNPVIVIAPKVEKTAPVIDPVILASFAKAREERQAKEAAENKQAKEDKRKCRALSKAAHASSVGAIAKRGRPVGSKNAHANRVVKEEKEEKTVEQRMVIALAPIPETSMSVDAFLSLCTKKYVGIVGQPSYRAYSVEQVFAEARAVLRGNREFDYVAPLVSQGIMTYANGIDIARRLVQAKKAIATVSVDELRRMGLVRSVELPSEKASREAFQLAKDQVAAFGIKEYDPKNEVLDGIVCKSVHAGMMPGVDSDARSGYNYKTAQDTLVRLMQNAMNKRN